MTKVAALRTLLGFFSPLNPRGGVRGKAEPSRAKVIAGDGAREGRGME